MRPRRAITRRDAAAAAAGALLSRCASQESSDQPSIEFTRIPQAAEGGLDKNDIIEGTVAGARPDQQIVLYAKSGTWWVQPLESHPFTAIQSSSKWSNATHLGTEYAAMLVEAGYRPPATVDVLPAAGGSVAAVAVVKGQADPPSRTLQFSGYEWRVRDAPSDRGGRNLYSPENAWTDASGALHLQIAQQSGEWTCAELSLTRSLGHGTYSFTVRDISGLEPVAVFGMFTWDYAGSDQNFREMDIEISRWGDPKSKNAQFVVQPYYVPANVVRFTAPPGVLTHSFRWEPERVLFKTVRGADADSADVVEQHVFTSGIPTPGIESVRMNLYVFRTPDAPLQHAAEVVVEKFQYLP